MSDFESEEPTAEYPRSEWSEREVAVMQSGKQYAQDIRDGKRTAHD